MEPEGIEIEKPECGPSIPIPLPPNTRIGRWLAMRASDPYDTIIRMIFALDLVVGFAIRDGWANTITILFLGAMTFGRMRTMLFGESD